MKIILLLMLKKSCYKRDWRKEVNWRLHVAITKSNRIITEIPSWWRDQKASISNMLFGSHVLEQHLKSSASPKALENPNMTKAGTSWKRQGVESCHFQTFCSQILVEILGKVLTLQERSLMRALLECPHVLWLT